MAHHQLHPGHHSVVDNCSMEHIDWAWDIFHECVTDNVQYVGFILGLVSILCWMFVFVPQFILSFRSGRMDEAVSPFFLLSWLLGDLSNLIGCLLTHQLGTQIATAYYYIVMDTLILMQYLYYVIKNRRRRIRGASLNTSINGSSTIPKDYNSIPASTEPNKVLYCVGGLYLFTCLYSVQTFGSSRTNLHSSRAIGRSLLSTTSQPTSDDVCRVYFLDTGDCLFESQRELIGYIIGSFSGVFYLGSRLPQIIRNFQRKSVEGLSVVMFILTVLGNTFYGLSILLEDVQPVFIVAHMPWLVGSIGTLIFDVILLIQFALYRNNVSVKVESEDEEETRSLLNSSGVAPTSNNTAIYS